MSTQQATCNCIGNTCGNPGCVCQCFCKCEKIQEQYDFKKNFRKLEIPEERPCPHCGKGISEPIYLIEDKLY